mgnify:CR=1 FL=1
MVLENWEELNKEYAEKGKKMLEEWNRAISILY